MQNLGYVVLKMSKPGKKKREWCCSVKNQKTVLMGGIHLLTLDNYTVDV